jgi:hypothetical protein
MRARRSARLSAVAATVLLGGFLVPGASSSAAGGRPAGPAPYICGFKGGDRDVTIGFAQTYPSRGRVGAPIQPGDLTATVTIARADADALLPASTGEVGADGTLGAEVSQSGSVVTAQWAGLRAPAVPAGGGGDLVLVLAGSVPGLSVTAPGTVGFTAHDLKLTLHASPAATPTPPPGTPGTPSAPDTGGAVAGGGGGADDVPATTAGASGTPTPPAAYTPAAPTDLGATCSPKDAGGVDLGSVPVPGEAGGGATSSTHSAGRAPSAAGGSTAPTGTPPAGQGPGAGRDSTIRLQAAQPPKTSEKDCTDADMPDGKLDPAVMAQVAKGRPATVNTIPFPLMAQCAYVTGFSNVAKLDAAAPINPVGLKAALAYVRIMQYIVNFDDSTKIYFEADEIARLAIPPSTAHFLTFGFVPTTATMKLVPHGLMTIVATGDADSAQDPPQLLTTTMTGRMDLSLSDVKVNGVPMDVGGSCHASAPLKIVLTGLDRRYVDPSPEALASAYDVATGGPLSQADLYIPPFTGCGAHGEDLDPLFTASISGHGNSLNLMQGLLCSPESDPTTCEPTIRFPAPPHR